MSKLFSTAPIRKDLNKNYLDQVILKFDFPIVLALADKDQEGRLVTSRKSDLFINLQNQLMKTLPVYKQIESKVITINIGDNRPSDDMPTEVVHTFKSLDQSKTCEISMSTFLFACKGGDSYQNFQTFLQEFWTVWEMLSNTSNIPSLTRVGLRKVNRFPLKDYGHAEIGKIVRPEFLPPIDFAGATTGDQFLGRQNFIINKEWKCNFHFGSYSKDPKANPSYLYDVDIFRDTPCEPKSIKDYLAEVNQCHWEMFWRFLNPEFYKNLEL